MAILMMLILPIDEHGTCFHLFVSSLISYFSVVQFSENRSFTSLVRLIPRYFIFLVAISNGIFFLISVSDVSLLVYRNAFEFSVLTFYLAVFPNSFISSSRFWWSLQDFPCTLSCHLQTLTGSFPPFNLDAFYFFFLSDCCGQDFQYYVEEKW